MKSDSGDMNDRDLAEVVVEALHEGIIPWCYPISMIPELAPTFGKLFRGEPMNEGNYTELDAIIAATGAKIIHHWRSRMARFHRIRDKIVLPLRSRFQGEAHYQATRIHEILHYLEHPWRLGWIGSDHQSELVCEVGTGLLELCLRLPPDHDLTNINKWLPQWSTGIAENHRYLFDAVAQAERSVNYLLTLRQQRESA